MAVLVTGGAGYIGSAFVELLRASGESVVVLDDLSRGHRAAVDPAVPLYVGTTGDRGLVTRIAREHRLDACVHFAAFAYVGESVTEPGRYFDNNTAQAVTLFETLLDAGVRHVVFSSTCATYGVPRESPIPEIPPPVAHQPLRLVEVLRGADAREPRPRTGTPVRGPALLQRRRRHREARRAPRPRDPHHSPRPRRPPRAGGPHVSRLRRRLRHPGRHRHPRLHPRRGPRRGAPPGPSATCARAARPSS